MTRGINFGDDDDDDDERTSAVRIVCTLNCGKNSTPIHIKEKPTCERFCVSEPGVTNIFEQPSIDR